MKNTLYLILPPIIIYLIFSWAPKKIGCLLPEKYCLDGIDKVSDILTISIALIPVFILFQAYNVWRKQKTAELLAVDAKNIYISLQGLLKKLSTFRAAIISSQGITSTQSEEYKNFRDHQKIILNELKLFHLLLTEEKSIHLNDFDKFYKYFEKFGRNLASIDILRVRQTDNTPAENHIHALDMVAGLKLDEFKSKIKSVDSTLSKIILHK